MDLRDLLAYQVFARNMKQDLGQVIGLSHEQFPLLQNGMTGGPDYISSLLSRPKSYKESIKIPAAASIC